MTFDLARAEQDFFRALSRGAPRDDAWRAAGLPIKALRLYMERAAAGQQPFVKFARTVESIEAKMKAKMIAALVDAAHGRPAEGQRGSWGATAFFLERRFARVFGKVDPEKIENNLMLRMNQQADRLLNVILRYVPEELQHQVINEVGRIFDEGDVADQG